MNKSYEEMTDAELSKEFAVKVACINFATSADAVLPWLEKTTELFEIYHDGNLWNFSDETQHISVKASTFARAACIALIKANETP